MSDLTPRAGDNTGAEKDYAKEEVTRLSKDYAAMLTTVDTLEAEEAAIALPIQDAGTKETVVDLMKRARDTTVRFEAMHDLEKQPHLRRGQGVDQFFFGMWDRLRKRNKTNRPGLFDRLQTELTDYDTRELAKERERLRKIAEEEERKRKEAEAIRIAAEQEAEEKRLAAERARKPEHQETKAQIADQAADVAAGARVEEVVATSSAEQAHVDTLRRDADIMRARTSAGTLSTMAQETYAEIADATKLNMAALWPYIPLAAKQTALIGWAKSTGHNTPMEGARIGRRPKSQVR